MGYMTESIKIEKYKRWLVFSGAGAVGNFGIAITAGEFLEKLKAVWPDAELIPEIAYAGALISLVAGILAYIVQKTFTLEILQTAVFAAILFAFYAFKPALFKLPAGIFIFCGFAVVVMLAYLVSQWTFLTKTIKKKGTTSDKWFYGIVLSVSYVIFAAPGVSILIK